VKKFGIILGLVALVVLLGLSLAEAARLGGGSSFGSRPSYSRSYTAPSSGTTQTAPRVAPQTTPPPVAPAAAAQPGFLSRFGMGLGGLVVGGLIGSMLFGHGGMGGGIGFLDILLIGLAIFLAVKLLRRRGAGPDSNDAGQGYDQNTGQNAGQAPPTAPSQGATDIRSRAEQSWEGLRSQPEGQKTGGFGDASAPAEPQPQPEPTVPAGFNVPEFLEGAKTVFARLQHSWDRRDLNDIALFTTPGVLEEIRKQAEADPNPAKTEVLLINARLVEFREEAADTVASVYFDVLLREDAAAERPKQVREVWHFSRPTGSPDANWRLEGIQQMEA